MKGFRFQVSGKRNREVENLVIVIVICDLEYSCFNLQPQIPKSLNSSIRNSQSEIPYPTSVLLAFNAEGLLFQLLTQPLSDDLHQLFLVVAETVVSTCNHSQGH